ncbi:MAG TPA: hypothetical protein VHZ29_16410 [Rhizomicrobium sp.]|jgi:hypothetical protein|nr:hypothetical protein [Rhizomicrobium sp.]
MKPEADAILNISADQLMAGVIPNLAASYLQGATAIHALLMKFAAREYERGADIRAAENGDIRALFAELGGEVRDPSLKARLDAAAAIRDASLTISALDAANAELRRLLIALHVHLEDTGAHAGEKRVWQLLKAMAARREMPLF